MLCCQKEDGEQQYSAGAGRTTHMALVSQEPACINCNRLGHFYYNCDKPLKESLRKRLRSWLEHAKKRADRQRESRTSQYSQPNRTESKQLKNTKRLNDSLESAGLMAFLAEEEDESECFKMNDGSTSHIRPLFQDFVEYIAFSEPRNVSGIENGKASGVGRVRMRSEIKGREIEFDLHEVLHIKTAPRRLYTAI